MLGELAHKETERVIYDTRTGIIIAELLSIPVGHYITINTAITYLSQTYQGEPRHWDWAMKRMFHNGQPKHSQLRGKIVKTKKFNIPSIMRIQ